MMENTNNVGDSHETYPELQLYINQKLDIIGHLAGGISHNFNNQLTGIMGFANLISLRSSDENIKKFAQEILGICKNTGDMVRELLTFARYRPVTTAGVDVHGIITLITQMLTNSLDKRITVENKFETERCTVLADAVQLQSVLLNIALNSKDAMPKGGTITFTTKFIDPSTCKTCGINPDHAASGCILIKVTDTGSGFNSEVRARLFEPFFTTKGEGHVGLGLSAVHRFVSSMNGTITVSSIEEKGTSVAITLPLHANAGEKADSRHHHETSQRGTDHQHGADDTSHDRRNAKANSAKKEKNGGTILLVDDDKNIRNSLSAFLRSHGYSVFTAEDGLEAVEKYGGTHAVIDMVILDMVMPRMGGKDAFIEMKKINPQIKAIAITVYSAHSSNELLELGMKRVLHKPFQFDELLDGVAKHT